MKYLSVIFLVIFLNFTALPGIAMLFDWEFLPELYKNNISEEEEVKHDFTSFNEKLPPKPYNFKDFIEIFQTDTAENRFLIKNDSIRLSPHISILSPPPEV